MDDKQLQAIRQLRLGVTDWPWTMYDLDSIWGTEGWVAEASSEGNGQFITQAPALVDDLLAEVERLRTENAALRLDNAEGRRAKGELQQRQLELARQDGEIERLRAENAAMREIVEAVAQSRVLRPLHGEVEFATNVDVTTLAIKARTLLTATTPGR